jgi:hypothetical protein
MSIVMTSAEQDFMKSSALITLILFYPSVPKEATMRRTALAVVGVIVLAGSSALAHHGYADFYLDQAVSVEGEIEAIQFGNPHVVLKVRAADSTVYTATWAGPSIVARQGVTMTTLKIGDHIVVIGCPPRNPASHEIMPVRAMRRPRDGWSWQSQVWAATHVAGAFPIAPAVRQ